MSSEQDRSGPSVQATAPQSLAVKPLRWRTLWLAVVTTGLLLGTCEGLSRINWLTDKLVSPSVGSTDPQFEVKLHRLDEYQAQHGSIDCIVLGSSQINLGFDPEVFGQVYYQDSGEELHCFNFGLAGITASEAGPIAEILVKRYHPSLLIYGTSLREYHRYSGGDANMAMIQIPWTSYELGDFVPLGWLAAHSRAYQYALTYAGWFRVLDWKKRMARERSITAFGSDNRVNQGHVIQALPDNFTRWYSDCPKTVEDTEGLQQVLGLQAEGTKIILVENPLPPIWMTVFDEDGDARNGKSNYTRCFVDWLDSYARAYDTILIRTNL